MEKKSSNFSGQIGFVLAAAGSAVVSETSGVSLTWLQRTAAGFFW